MMNIEVLKIVNDTLENIKNYENSRYPQSYD